MVPSPAGQRVAGLTFLIVRIVMVVVPPDSNCARMARAKPIARAVGELLLEVNSLVRLEIIASPVYHAGVCLTRGRRLVFAAMALLILFLEQEKHAMETMARVRRMEP